jgi:uncharacterized phiE125 gp8 family phage protein
MDNVHVIARPADEPVTLDEALLDFRLDAYGSPAEHPDEALIQSMITAARELAENHINAKIAEWQLELRLPGFCQTILIPDAPLQSIDAVTYIDTNGATQTVDPALYELAGRPEAPVLRPVYGASWPTSVRAQDDAVRIRYTAGYTTGSPDTNPVPEVIKKAIRLIAGHMYENRENVVIGASVAELPMGALFMLQPYRRHMGV